MQQDFSGHTAIITGASMGVGAATARAFAERGANVVMIARGRDRLEAAARELAETCAAGDRIMTEALDVSDQGALQAALDRIRARFGGIDILVNNAGYHARGPFETLTPEQIRQMIEVNLTAPLVATRLVLDDLKRSQRPAVINVASLAGRTPVPGSVVYSATKFGLRAFGMALAEELHGSRIRIASVSPGPIDTAFIMDDIDSVSDLTFSQPIVTPEQVAAAIVRLVEGGPRDLTLPRISGWLTTLTYLFPGLGRMMRPMLERRGRRTKARIKRERSRQK
ncbi:MAG: SDR family oxidoreductase [Wenzhouxiangellaceae bacterium]